MDAAFAHMRMTLGLNWVAADKDTRIYAYDGKPFRDIDMWENTELFSIMVHIGYYTGKQSWRKSKRGAI